MVGRDALREYVRGSLWVLPGLSVLAAPGRGGGAVVGQGRIAVAAGLPGDPDDARTLLLGITGTMITVIALLLGLAVVALQLSSTQFSPRLLRNFLRDRPNQVVLSAFVATFAYSAAGLVHGRRLRRQPHRRLPRLAVSGAIVLLFASLGLLVFFADHLLHSIQVDAIMERGAAQHPGGDPGRAAHRRPAMRRRYRPGRCRSPSRRSGYVQAVRPGRCCRAPPGTASACACGPGSASTWSPGRRWPGSGAPRPRDPAPDPAGLRPSPGQPGSGSGSSGPWSRTPRSGSGSWSTWRARRCPRRSTTRTPRSRPSITCR